MYIFPSVYCSVIKLGDSIDKMFDHWYGEQYLKVRGTEIYDNILSDERINPEIYIGFRGIPRLLDSRDFRGYFDQAPKQ